VAPIFIIRWRATTNVIDFSGETAVVTGSAQGFGRAIAKRLSEFGANVVLADVQAEKARGVAAEIEDDGGTAAVVDCEVTDRASVARMAERTRNRFGTIEILVNNAGGSSGDSFADLDPAEWDAGVALNLTGPYNCAHAVCPGMLEHGNGRVINISSMAGRNVTLNGNPSYTSSKWGVIGLSKHMARDLAPAVRVNALCPGGGPNSPMGRAGTPADVANGVLFLASDLAEFVNGTVLEVDGGSHLNQLD